MGKQHYNKASLFILIWFGLNVAHLQAFNGQYPIQNFTPADYKAGIQNIDFAQNRDRTIFVANNLGVLAYDGNEWEVHAIETGKKERSLAFDASTNRLYVGSQGTFGYFSGDWEYVSLIDLVPTEARDFDEVWEVFLIDGRVYFCTFQGIYIYDGQSITVIGQEVGLNRSFHVNNKLFTQNQRGQLFEFKDQQLQTAFPQLQQDEIVAGILPSAEGYLIFYNSGAIEMTGAFGVRPAHDQLMAAIRGTYVNHVRQLSGTRVVIATQTAGLFLYDLQNKSLENISSRDGLLTNACLRTFQDHSGQLWVGMQNGLALIDIDSPMRFINQSSGLAGSGYDAFETDEGTYYTTSNGIYFLSGQSGEGQILAGTEGPAYSLQEVAGKIYAGHHTGLFLLEDGRARRVVSTEGMWRVRQLRSRPGYAIGGTYAGLFLFKFNAERVLAPVGKIEGFDESSRFFEEGRQGNIWVGQFYKGLFRLELDENLLQARVHQLTEADGLPVNDHIILSRVDNELYLATWEGIYRIDQSTNQIGAAPLFDQEIGRQQVYLLEQDRQKNIHIYTNKLVGFFKQLSPANYTFIPSSLYQLRYSFNNDLLHVATNIREGVLYNANEGFIHYRPEQENRVGRSRPLAVSRVLSVSQDSVLFARMPFAPDTAAIAFLQISHRDQDIQFEVKSFQFGEVNDRVFRYFLEGFDPGYSEWSNAPLKEYTNLPAGDYTLFVQTRNYLGELITNDGFELTVTPPFHQSWPARVLYLLAGIGLLVWVSRRQKKKYQEKAAAVEAAKEKELAMVEQEKEEKLQALEATNFRNELGHLNKLLAASTMNLVVKNEFIVNIKERLQEVNRQGKNKATKQALGQIVKEIDTTLRLQEDWDQFEHHFNKVHGDFLARLRGEFSDLSPNEQKLCVFLRLNLNTKDIANLMGISQRGVEVARYRLRKKLGLETGQNLAKFVLGY